MPVFELTRKSEGLDDCDAEESKGPVIVRAQDEKSARSKATCVSFPLIAEAEEETGRDTPTVPWCKDELIICRQLDKSELDKLGYEEEGPEEILSPTM